jgi:hypothetical protein
MAYLTIIVNKKCLLSISFKMGSKDDSFTIEISGNTKI